MNLLIKSYQDQIDTLKEELKEKNNIIFDILNAGRSTVKRRQPIKNVDMTIPEEIPTLPQTNSSRNVQEKAQKSVVCKAKKTVSSQKDESKAIKTCNRLSSLADNEWVKSYDSESVLEIDECLSSSSKSKEGSSVKRRPNVIVEQNPEVNTTAPNVNDLKAIDGGINSSKRKDLTISDIFFPTFWNRDSIREINIPIEIQYNNTKIFQCLKHSPTNRS